MFRCSFRVLFFCLVTAGSNTAVAAQLTSFAGASNSSNSCVTRQDSFVPSWSGPATASAVCDSAGNSGSGFASASFASLFSNSLTVVASAATPSAGSANVDASGDASWTERLVVHGGTGSGWLEFDFTGQGTQTGDPAGVSCFVDATGFFSGTPAGQSGCNAASLLQQGQILVPFTFDEAFFWGIGLHIETMVPTSNSLAPQAISVNWTVSLQAVTVRDSDSHFGNVIPGATVELIEPEPGTRFATIVGVLVCIGLALRRRMRTV